MTVEQLEALLDQPVGVLELVAPMTSTKWDDAVLSALKFVKENRQFVGWLHGVISPLFGCDKPDCDCPAELRHYVVAFEALQAERMPEAA